MKKEDQEAKRLQAELRQKEVIALKQKIEGFVSKVPSRVLSGSHGDATQWKESAIEGTRLLKQQRPSLDKLREVVSALSRYAA